MFLGFDTEGLPTAVWPGGETEALTRIERHLERKVCTVPGVHTSQKYTQSIDCSHFLLILFCYPEVKEKINTEIN